MNHNSPLTSCREDIKNFLKSRSEFNYIDIRESYINVKNDLPLKRPLVTISKGKPITNAIGFSNCVTERFDEVNYEIIETQAKELIIAYDFHIWNSTSPKFGGEKEVERIQEQLQSIFDFESNAMAEKGITFFSFQEGTAAEDPEEDLFHARCTLEIKVLWKKEFKFEVMDVIELHGDMKEV